MLLLLTSLRDLTEGFSAVITNFIDGLRIP